MSAISYANENCLDFRSSASKPGARKFAKTSYIRSARKQAKKTVAQEVHLLNPALVDPAQLHELSEDQLNAYADWLMAQHAEETAQDCIDDVDMDLCALAEQVGHELSRVPLHLQASLPDWMISQLHESNGNAFDVLSLFESKSPSPQAAISMVDDVMYA